MFNVSLSYYPVLVGHGPCVNPLDAWCWRFASEQRKRDNQLAFCILAEKNLFLLALMGLRWHNSRQALSNTLKPEGMQAVFLRNRGAPKQPIYLDSGHTVLAFVFYTLTSRIRQRYSRPALLLHRKISGSQCCRPHHPCRAFDADHRN